jgi:mono/diheme cytochrome c family protein
MITQISCWVAGLCLGLSGVVLAEPDGASLYRENCVKCHGETGMADTWRGRVYRARQFANAKWQKKVSDDRILQGINEGPGAMPAFAEKFSAEEKQALIMVIRGFAPPPEMP